MDLEIILANIKRQQSFYVRKIMKEESRDKEKVWKEKYQFLVHLESALTPFNPDNYGEKDETEQRRLDF